MAFRNVRSLLQVFHLHLAFPEGGYCNLKLPGCSFVSYFAFFFSLLFRFFLPVSIFISYVILFSLCALCMCTVRLSVAQMHTEKCCGQISEFLLM